MSVSRQQAAKMSVRELRTLIITSGCHPDSSMWAEVWPVYELKRSRADARRTWICFGISTALAVAALITSVLK